MARPARRGFARWASLAAAALLALVYVVNVPYYSGSSLGAGLAWRMEHGRITLKRSPLGSTETLYVAPNAEGLRFSFEGDWWNAGEWSATIPLWAPLLVAAGWAGWAWRRPRGAPST